MELKITVQEIAKERDSETIIKTIVSKILQDALKNTRLRSFF